MPEKLSRIFFQSNFFSAMGPNILETILYVQFIIIRYSSFSQYGIFCLLNEKVVLFCINTQTLYVKIGTAKNQYSWQRKTVELESVQVVI